MATIEKAVEIAAKGHSEQKDKSDAPYILHPLRVMSRVNSIDEKIVAILHDVIEDTAYTESDLRRAGFSDKVVDAVLCLTKKAGESYDAFVDRAKSNPLARAVKIADIEDNLDTLRLNELTDDDLERIRKYHRSWGVLTAS